MMSPSQPFVILLSLTGLCPDMGYKSNQKPREDDIGMGHAFPQSSPVKVIEVLLQTAIDTDCYLECEHSGFLSHMLEKPLEKEEGMVLHKKSNFQD